MRSRIHGFNEWKENLNMPGSWLGLVLHVQQIQWMCGVDTDPQNLCWSQRNLGISPLGHSLRFLIALFSTSLVTLLLSCPTSHILLSIAVV